MAAIRAFVNDIEAGRGPALRAAARQVAEHHYALAVVAPLIADALERAARSARR